MKNNLKKYNAFSLYDWYGYALTQEPLHRGNEIYKFGRPFLGHHYYVNNFTPQWLGLEKNILI